MPALDARAHLVQQPAGAGQPPSPGRPVAERGEVHPTELDGDACLRPVVTHPAVGAERGFPVPPGTLDVFDRVRLVA
jgi:hypothetical protein